MWYRILYMGLISHRAATYFIFLTTFAMHIGFWAVAFFGFPGVWNPNPNPHANLNPIPSPYSYINPEFRYHAVWNVDRGTAI